MFNISYHIYNSKYTTKPVKFGGGSLIVFGDIKEEDTGILTVSDEMNSIGYK